LRFHTGKFVGVHTRKCVWAVFEQLRRCLPVAGVDAGELAGVDTAHPARGIAVGILGNRIPPLAELGTVPSWHILNVLGHLHCQVVLGDKLGVTVLQLNQLLLELRVAQQGVRIVHGVVDDPAELGRGGANREAHHHQKNEQLLFHFISFFGLRDLRAFCALSNRARRDRLRGRPSRDVPRGL
jgi:hypothetical protein